MKTGNSFGVVFYLKIQKAMSGSAPLVVLKD